jgi:peptidoglycan/xylan/chitin deacetylase (PgdA/CDA1 family)
MSIRTSLKQGTLSLLRSAGAFPVISNLRRRQDKLLILCYHGIALRDEHRWLGQLYIPPDLFRRRLENLKSYGANVIPFDEGIERLRSHSLAPRSMVITFDDGFYDFYHNAFPILRSFGFPCTLYLTTHYCQYRVPIFNLVLNYLLWKSERVNFDFPAMGIDEPMPLRGHLDRTKVVQKIMRWAGSRQMTTLEKDQVARQLAARFQIDYDDLLRSRLLQIMSPSEVSAIAKSDVQVQLHTHRHRTPRDRALFEREIHDNQERILEYTGSKALDFCYPSGDYSYEFLPWLQNLGVRSATTCESGLAKRSSEPLLLPRLLDSTNISELDYHSWLCGVQG